jgi:cytochrome c oxidase subunit I
LSVLLFFINIGLSRRKAKANRLVMVADPWDGRSLEWMATSPPPAHNFDEVPTIRVLDDFWHRKYGEDEQGRLVRIAATEDVVDKGVRTDVHLPSPSYWPIVLAFGLPLLGYGLIYNLWFCVPGGLCVIAGVYGWVMEPSVDPGTEQHHDDHGPGDEPDDHEADTGGATPADEEAALVD